MLGLSQVGRRIGAALPVTVGLLLLMTLVIPQTGATARAQGVIATIAVGSSPAGVGVNPVTNRVYVANFGSDTVSVIDGNTNTVIATIDVGSSPNGVAVNPGANRIYATNVASNSVSVIDGSTNGVIATIPVSGASPFFAAVNPKSNRAYVSFLGVETGGVDVINGVTNHVLATIPDAQGTRGVAVNTANNRVYFVNQPNSTESAVAGIKVIDTLHLGGGLGSFDVAVNPETDRVYVANIGIAASAASGARPIVSPSPTQAGLPVTVIDGKTNTVVTSIPVGAFLDAIAVNPTTNRIYVASLADGVSVINGFTNNVVATVSVGPQPDGIGVNPQTSLIYVANSGDGTVSVIQD